MVVTRPGQLPEKLGRRESVTRAELMAILGGPAEWVEITRPAGVYRIVTLVDQGGEVNGLASLAVGRIVNGPSITIHPSEEIV